MKENQFKTFPLFISVIVSTYCSEYLNPGIDCHLKGIL